MGLDQQFPAFDLLRKHCPQAVLKLTAWRLQGPWAPYTMAF
jgi:hypothetical protein